MRQSRNVNRFLMDLAKLRRPEPEMPPQPKPLTVSLGAVLQAAIDAQARQEKTA